MKNRNLALAIPTYNRADILDENLRLMLPEIEKYSIPIYISDDSTNDETEKNVKKLKTKYDYIYYTKNNPGLGHDLNCIQTLGLPSEDYIWYLGDSFIIETGGLQQILDFILGHSYGFIALNAIGRVNIPDRIFMDGNELLINLGWHLTLTSATIYSKRSLKLIETLDIGKCKNFPQTAIIFEQFAKANIDLFWINHPIIFCNSRKLSYWRENLFEVFLSDWNSFILNLPQFYSSKNKQIAITSHAKETGIFNLYSFLSYRYQGIFDYKVFNRFSRLIRKNCNTNIVLVFIISLIPKSILYFFRFLLKRGKMDY